MSPFLLGAYPLQFLKVTLDKNNEFAVVKLVRGWHASGAPGRPQNLFVASYLVLKVHRKVKGFRHSTPTVLFAKHSTGHGARIMLEVHPFTFEIQADPLRESRVSLDGL